MRLFFAGTGHYDCKKWFEQNLVSPHEVNVLESYYSISKWQIGYIHKFRSFLLDSGAFSFLFGAQKGKKIDWLSYADKYADFVKENNIKRYFELDLDSVIGLSEVTKLRNRIEKRVGWQSIPVWHETRNKDYWENIMCKDYTYVAIGGISNAKLNRNKKELALPWFINSAHKNRCWIHGLGYTSTSKLSTLRFDSSDSTSWLAGVRYGTLYQFTGNSIKTLEQTSKNGIRKYRIINQARLNYHNFSEWLKFAKYLEAL